MAMGLARLFSRRQRAPLAEVAAEPAAIPDKSVVVDRHPRIGLWVLSSFATIAALVAMSALVIGPQHADAIIFIPLVLFWSVVVSVGFAIRSALIGVARSMARKVGRKADKPDATLERLARMVRQERNREALNPYPAPGLAHAG